MWMDVVDTRDFYASPMGGVARRMIRNRIRALWPDLGGLELLGLGYAAPYLGPFRTEAARVLAFMPASQGVLRWPAEGGALAALVDEAALPLPDLSLDRVLLIHAVEHSEQLRPMLREVWRVLRGNGRVLVVAANRTGIWARLDRTPFGYGRPYSAAQLSALLRESLFTPQQSDRALFVPPTRSRMMLSAAGAWEQIGRRWFGTFSGVVMVEASKQIYAVPPAVTVPAGRRRVYLPRTARTSGR